MKLLNRSRMVNSLVNSGNNYFTSKVFNDQIRQCIWKYLVNDKSPIKIVLASKLATWSVIFITAIKTFHVRINWYFFSNNIIVDWKFCTIGLSVLMLWRIVLMLNSSVIITELYQKIITYFLNCLVVTWQQLMTIISLLWLS